MLDLALNDRIFLNDELDCALQELDMLLNTENTQLLGMPGYGFNIDPYLYTLSPATEALQQYIENIIDTYTFYARRFNPQVIISYYTGDYKSIYVVKIILTDNTGLSKSRNYKFE